MSIEISDLVISMIDSLSRVNCIRALGKLVEALRASRCTMVVQLWSRLAVVSGALQLTARRAGRLVGISRPAHGVDQRADASAHVEIVGVAGIGEEQHAIDA